VARVAIATDSASDLTPADASRADITIVAPDAPFPRTVAALLATSKRPSSAASRRAPTRSSP